MQTEKTADFKTICDLAIENEFVIVAHPENKGNIAVLSEEKFKELERIRKNLEHILELNEEENDKFFKKY